MTNYAVTKWAGSAEADVDDALSALKTKIETIDNTKVIRMVGVAVLGDGKYFQPYIVYDT